MKAPYPVLMADSVLVSRRRRRRVGRRIPAALPRKTDAPTPRGEWARPLSQRDGQTAADSGSTSMDFADCGTRCRPLRS
ncbi:hypothetical protein GCM10010289_59240 [Streptomyces violascens]|nr:hypothetical protein GCM10010289_59240 [Streptomyces violascens]